MESLIEEGDNPVNSFRFLKLPGWSQQGLIPLSLKFDSSGGPNSCGGMVDARGLKPRPLGCRFKSCYEYDGVVTEWLKW